MFGNDVINQALIAIGVNFVGSTAGPDSLAICQTALNNMLAEWNAQGLAVYSVVLNTYSLTNGVGTYTLGGAGGTPNLSTSRAEKIEAWAVHGSAAGSDGGKPLSPTDFERERNRLDAAAAELGILSGAQTGSRVMLLNYDANFPIATINVYPIPGTGLTIDLWTWDQIVAIVDFVATALAFPPAYLKAIVYNLAVDVAPFFSRPVSQTVQKLADDCKATIAATNISELTRLDPKLESPAQK